MTRRKGQCRTSEIQRIDRSIWIACVLMVIVSMYVLSQLFSVGSQFIQLGFDAHPDDNHQNHSNYNYHDLNNDFVQTSALKILENTTTATEAPKTKYERPNVVVCSNETYSLRAQVCLNLLIFFRHVCLHLLDSSWLLNFD